MFVILAKLFSAAEKVVKDLSIQSTTLVVSNPKPARQCKDNKII